MWLDIVSLSIIMPYRLYVLSPDVLYVLPPDVQVEPRYDLRP